MVNIINGGLPVTLLGSIGNGRFLRLGADAGWYALVAFVERHYGWTPTPSAGDTAYRSYDEQVNIFKQNYVPYYLPGRPKLYWAGKWWWQRFGKATAARPGTSNHGLGIAIDISSLGSFTSTRYRQLAVAAAATGWNNVQGKRIGEYWHWVFSGRVLDTAPTKNDTTTAPATPPEAYKEDEDMLPTILWCYSALMGRAALPSDLEVGNWLSGTGGWTSADIFEAFMRARPEPSSVAKAFKDYGIPGIPTPTAIAFWITKPNLRDMRAGIAYEAAKS